MSKRSKREDESQVKLDKGGLINVNKKNKQKSRVVSNSPPPTTETPPKNEAPRMAGEEAPKKFDDKISGLNNADEPTYADSVLPVEEKVDT